MASNCGCGGRGRVSPINPGGSPVVWRLTHPGGAVVHYHQEAAAEGDADAVMNAETARADRLGVEPRPTRLEKIDARTGQPIP